MSLIIRLELAAPGNQILYGNHQLFNGTPSNYHSSILRLFIEMIKVSILKFLLWIIINSLQCVKHITKPVGANFTVTIVCYKRGMISVPQVKRCYMIRLTNPLQVCGCVGNRISHSEILLVVMKVYIEPLLLGIWLEPATENSLQMGDLSSNHKGDDKNWGSPEKGNFGGDGGSIIPNIYGNINLISRRYYSIDIIGKGTRKDTSEEIKSAGLKKLEELTISNSKNSKKKEAIINKNIISILKDKDILMLAYSNIKSKPGNMTSGVGTETLDGINNIWFDNISKDIGTGQFKFTPARRIQIPKAKGGTRPLSIGTPREKIVQEALRMILNAIFNEQMSVHSHGFRPSSP